MDSDEYIQYQFSIMRRQRGVYLAHWYEQFNGIEEWDAFATLDAAKRWCAEVVDRKRLPWTKDGPGYWESELAPNITETRNDDPRPA